MISQTYRDFVPTTFAWKHNAELDLCHCILGLLGELEELEGVDTEVTLHYTEELGDVLYYLTMTCLLLNHTPEIVDTDVPDDEPSLFGYIVNRFKKYIFYNHRNTDIYHPLDLTYTLLCTEGDLPELEQTNMKKLLKRYPNGFTSQDAKDRADKEE